MVEHSQEKLVIIRKVKYMNQNKIIIVIVLFIIVFISLDFGLLYYNKKKSNNENTTNSSEKEENKENQDTKRILNSYECYVPEKGFEGVFIELENKAEVSGKYKFFWGENGIASGTESFVIKFHDKDTYDSFTMDSNISTYEPTTNFDEANLTKEYIYSTMIAPKDNSLENYLELLKNSDFVCEKTH